MPVAVRMPDGTTCRKGVSCRRHGATLKQMIVASKQKATPPARPVETVADVHAAGNEHLYDAFMEVHEVAPGEFLCIERPGFAHNRFDSRQERKIWYRKDGRNVGYAKISRNLYALGNGDQVKEYILATIEVNPAARGTGAGRALVDAIHALPFLEGEQLHTSGGFTPEGFKAFGTSIPLSKYVGRSETSSVKYDSMAFVDDWERFRLL